MASVRTQGLLEAFDTKLEIIQIISLLLQEKLFLYLLPRVHQWFSSINQEKCNQKSIKLFKKDPLIFFPPASKLPIFEVFT